MPDRAIQFGGWTLTFLVIANMVGAGVFTTSGYTLEALGSPQRVMWAWGVGGLIALAGAISYGQLARAMPESGGEYLFLSRTAHPLLGFIAGWISLIAGFSGAIAFAALALEGYVWPHRERPLAIPQGGLAIASIVVCGACHGVRPHWGAWVQNLVVALKLGLLALFLILAIFLGSGSRQWQGAALPEFPREGWPLLVAFAGSLVWISLSYSGFNAAVYIAGEAAEAERRVPRALLAGTLTVCVIYLLLNAVFVFAPPPESIAGVEDVAAQAARAIAGEGLARLVRGTICAALLTSVLSMMMAAPRVYMKMAEDGLLPGLRGGRDLSRASATLLQVLVSSTLVYFSSLQDLLSYLGLTLSLSAAGTVTCLFSRKVLPRWRAAHLAAGLYVAATLIIAAVWTISNPWQLGGTLLTVLAGGVAFVATRRWLGNRPTGGAVESPAP